MKSKVLFFLLITHYFVCAQESQNKSPILFIYDASGSMWAQVEGKSRIQIARDVLSGSLQKLPDDQKIGLMAYGHRKKGDCEDVEFLVGMDNVSKEEIIHSLEAVKPLGMTPLAYSATMAIGKLRELNIRTTIILITDGIESCGGNICDVVTAAKKEGIEFRLHIIGFGLKESDTEQLKCAALAGEGNYYDASDAEGLENVLNETFKQTVDKPNGNVTVFAVKNGQPIDALVKAYDLISKRAPISVRTYGDTAAFFLPPSTYNFEVSPLEGSDVKMITVPNVQSFEDRVIHKEFSFNSGKIGVTTTNNGENWDCIVKVSDQSGNVIASVRTYKAPKELDINPGTYNISIQALVMEGLNTSTEIKNITVGSNKIMPVSFNFKTGKLLLETFVGDKSVDSIVTISEANSGKGVSAKRTYGREKEILLNPGKYLVKAVPLGDHKNRESKTITVDVTQNQNTTKKIIL